MTLDRSLRVGVGGVGVMGTHHARVYSEMKGVRLVRQAEPLRLELEAFLDAATGHRPPVVTGRDGRRALDVALRAAAA